VVVDGVLNHIHETLVVAACIAREALLGIDFPAVVVVGGAREDGNETFFLAEREILCVFGPLFAVATATVYLRACLESKFAGGKWDYTYMHDYSGLIGRIGWNIEVKLQVGWVWAPVRYGRESAIGSCKHCG
jgi:hypothetical protein